MREYNVGYGEAEGGTVWPFYLVADVSDSMRTAPSSPTPFDALMSGADDLFKFIRNDVQVQDQARVCVIAFAGEPTVMMEMQDISAGYVLREWPEGGWTNYAGVLTLLDQLIERHIVELESKYDKVSRPTVFFITDGEPGNRTEGTQPYSTWGPRLSE